MKPRVVNSMLLVERFDKAKKDGDTLTPFVTAISSNNYGTVKHSSTPHLYPEGAEIYFGSSYQKILVEGQELLAMKEENVIAVMEE